MRQPIQSFTKPRWFWLFMGLLLVPSFLVIVLNLYVIAVTQANRYTTEEKVPPRRVALVFGAGLAPDGTVSSMLGDRVSAAVNLYKLGRVQKLLMTGDNSEAYYDEVTAMKRYAMILGVPEADITLDYAGFSTYESCYRAIEIFGVQQAVLVTQKYHLPRSVYICRQFKIDAVGLGTPDWETYGHVRMIPYTVREGLATIKALWFVHATRPQPTFLGPYEGIK
ncbi:MAG: ElyC/SanA/YdcF family protein [Leptolyngbyaceae cyanobacterium bins.59]|nr:ElyC/SanA/YdcF family protein [Leptolyngbyaceae cyanobacterium bins.59]